MVGMKEKQCVGYACYSAGLTTLDNEPKGYTRWRHASKSATLPTSIVPEEDCADAQEGRRFPAFARSPFAGRAQPAVCGGRAKGADYFFIPFARRRLSRPHAGNAIIGVLSPYRPRPGEAQSFSGRFFFVSQALLPFLLDFLDSFHYITLVIQLKFTESNDYETPLPPGFDRARFRCR